MFDENSFPFVHFPAQSIAAPTTTDSTLLGYITSWLPRSTTTHPISASIFPFVPPKPPLQVAPPNTSNSHMTNNHSNDDVITLPTNIHDPTQPPSVDPLSLPQSPTSSNSTSYPPPTSPEPTLNLPPIQTIQSHPIQTLQVQPIPTHTEPNYNTHSIHIRSKSRISKKMTFEHTINHPLPTALLSLLDQKEPTCYTSASTKVEWRTTMDHEFTTLQKCETWSLVPYKPTMNVAVKKWVYRIKRNADGSTNCYKAQLVAKGFH